MLKNWCKKLVLMLMIPGFLLVVSCAQQNVVPVEGNGDSVSTDTAVEAPVKKDTATDETLKDAASEMKKKMEMAKDNFVNRDVLFGYDSAALTGDAQALLAEKAAWLKSNPGVHVVVEGHCDDRGTTEYNLGLGERRAVSAKNFLVTLGVSPARLDTISYGEEKPVAHGDNEAAYKKNRRAHMTLK